MKKEFWKKVTAIFLTASVMLTAVPIHAAEEDLAGIDADYELSTEGEASEEEPIFVDDVWQDNSDSLDYDENALIDDEFEIDPEAETESELPINDAFADESADSEETADEAEEPKAANIIDSGTCGGNLTWTLDSEGTLTISGTGPMEDSPFSGIDNVKTVIIVNGVASIGDSAFRSCKSLTSITIPDSVTSIGDFAFCLCESLTSITIPDSVTSIGEYAFYSGTLTSITIPNSVISIGEKAFCKWAIKPVKSTIIELFSRHYIQD